MEVTIHYGPTVLSSEDEAQVRQRIHFALERLSGRIRTLQVRLSDLNGPRGGIDKRCTMQAVLTRHGSLVVDVKGADAVVAAGLAAKRLARRVSNASERSRDLRRRGAGKGIAATPIGDNGGAQ